jgi:hypothetical protein
MFRCQKCGRITDPKEHATVIVTGKRRKHYPTREYKTRRKDGKDKRRGNKILDRGGKGWEIESEIMVCDTCNPAYVPPKPKLPKAKIIMNGRPVE